MELSSLSSFVGIIAATMVAVEVLKKAVGNRAWFRAVPTWAYACAVSAALTAGAYYLGILDEPGAWYEVVLKAVGLAATASGFWTWLRAPNDQIQDSARAQADVVKGRKAGIGLGLVVLLTVPTLSGCFSAQPVTKPQVIHRLALVSETYAGAVKRLQAWEIDVHRAGRISEADHQAWQGRFERLAVAGTLANAAIRAADIANVQAQAKAILDIVEALILEQVIRLSESERLSATLILEAIRTAVLVWSATLDTDRLGDPAVLASVRTPRKPEPICDDGDPPVQGTCAAFVGAH